MNKNTLCSISTSWRSKVIDNPELLISSIKDIGASVIELEFRIASPVFEEIKKRREEWGVKISSLHAVCPASAKGLRGAEKFMISDCDEERRQKGVEDIVKTMRNASEVGAGAVIVHCGSVPMEEPIYGMMKLYDKGEIGGDSARTLLHEALSARMATGKRTFEALLKSLDEINREAEKLGINVGLENRYYFREMPNLEEFGVIFYRFEGGRLFYWHDTGHAHAQETLFGVSQKMLLETFSHKLIGVHLHDAVGYTDHNEPGCGDIDFDMVAGYLKPETIRVMELNKRVSPENARQGIEFLKGKGIFV